jgi:hypothetical protein
MQLLVAKAMEGLLSLILHYGRDALIGIALFLSRLAHTKLTTSRHSERQLPLLFYE